MTASTGYAVLTEPREGLVRDQRGVSNSATLIWDGDDAVLVDTFPLTDQNDRLIEWIRSRGKNLAAVYVTHGHGDHTFGIGQLREAFPRARFLATPGTSRSSRDKPRRTCTRASGTGSSPVSVRDDVGDPTLLDSGARATRRTRSARRRLRAQGRSPWRLAHRHRRDHRYLRDVAEVERTASDALDFYRRMLAVQPGRLNIGSLWGAARALMPEPPADSAPR
ncbi:MBL fold metallo-hydrolase [Microbacterium caowuchunii]|uniref:MBL fold metallo-hydrolase n=1 Tax=Microbacterium caowuchunii TaxID=2614638 RepID=UPI001EE78EE8|nr:MBL fold metallo-hydrolase [Microbacterium caowuchunii]